MKKNGLLKIIGILALIIMVLSWIIPASYYSGSTVIDLGTMPVGIFDILSYPFLSFQYFIQTVVFILTVGALYGILENTGKYRNILEKLVKRLKGKEQLFIIVITLILTALSSILGLNLMMFIFIPALVSTILLMGYDKITAFLITIIPMFIGMIGSTYSIYINGYINQVTGITGFSNDLLTKVALLVIGYVIYIMFTLNYAKKVKKSKIEAEEEIPFIGEKKQVKKSSWPISVIFAIIFVLVILAPTPWVDVFGVEFFTNLHEAISNWTIGEYTIGANLLGYIEEFGSWTYLEISMIVFAAAIIIGFVYKQKLSEIIENMLNGLKKMLKPALLVSFSMMIIIMTAYHPFYITVTDYIINLSENFNIFLTSFITIIGSVLNVDMIYLAQSSIPLIAGTFPATEAINSLAIITQSFYGLTMLIAPTSTLLILGLTYLDIPYIEWLKKSWKFLLELFVVIVIIIFISVLI